MKYSFLLVITKILKCYIILLMNDYFGILTINFRFSHVLFFFLPHLVWFRCFCFVLSLLLLFYGVELVFLFLMVLLQCCLKKMVAIKCVIVCVVEFGILVIIISLKHIQYLIGLAVRTYKICVYEVSSQGLEVRTFSWFFYTRISHKFIILS